MAIRWDDPLEWVGEDVWAAIGENPYAYQKHRIVEVYPNQRCVALKGVEQAVRIDLVYESEDELVDFLAGIDRPSFQDATEFRGTNPILVGILLLISIVLAWFARR